MIIELQARASGLHIGANCALWSPVGRRRGLTQARIRCWPVPPIGCDVSPSVLLGAERGRRRNPVLGPATVAADHVEYGWCLVIGSGRIRHGPANLDTDQNEKT
jgi:hypothetical protein